MHFTWNNSYLYLSIWWVVYCTTHSLLASGWWKSMIVKSIREKARWYRLIYNLIALTGLTLLIFYEAGISKNLVFTPGIIGYWIGIVIGSIGTVMMLICIQKYFASFSGIWEEKTGDQLITTGLHHWMRHPLYFGTFLMLWGLWIAFPLLSVLISNTVITIYTLIAVQWEEKKLIERFGNAYKDYKKRVPMLFPRISRN